MIIMEQTKLYIARYKIVYKRAVKEAKRRENDNFLLNANNKSKAAWQIINKETGRTLSKTQDIIISKALTKSRIQRKKLNYLIHIFVKFQRNCQTKMGTTNQHSGTTSLK